VSDWRFRPTLWPTLFTLPALVVLLGLGTWQVDRLYWKRDLIETRVSRSSAPAIQAPDRIDDFAAMAFRKVRVAGVFLHDKEMYLGARTMRGNVGYQVVTPLRRAMYFPSEPGSSTNTRLPSASSPTDTKGTIKELCCCSGPASFRVTSAAIPERTVVQPFCSKTVTG